MDRLNIISYDIWLCEKPFLIQIIGHMYFSVLWTLLNFCQSWRTWTQPSKFKWQGIEKNGMVMDRLNIIRFDIWLCETPFLIQIIAHMYFSVFWTLLLDSHGKMDRVYKFVSALLVSRLLFARSWLPQDSALEDVGKLIEGIVQFWGFICWVIGCPNRACNVLQFWQWNQMQTLSTTWWLDTSHLKICQLIQGQLGFHAASCGRHFLLYHG